MKKMNQGFSLIEMMISVVLGLILMSGVIQMFLSSRAAFSSQQAISRVQETGRLAVEFLARDIRMAGFLGCTSKDGTTTSTLNSPTTFPNDWLTFVMGYHVTSSASSMPATSDSGISHAPQIGTDMIVIRGASISGAVTTAVSTDTTIYSKVVSTSTAGCGTGSDMLNGLCPNDIAVEANCTKATVFQITSIQNTAGVANIAHVAAGTPGNATATWGGAPSDTTNAYAAGAEVLKMNRIIYFIATGSSGNPTLFQNAAVRNTTTGAVTYQDTELLDGVENVHLSYGVDTSATPDGIPDIYQDANSMSAAQWSKVLSVRVEILVRSADNNVVSEPQKYTFNSATVSPPAGDLHLRQVFTTTVGIRSRLP